MMKHKMKITIISLSLLLASGTFIPITYAIKEEPEQNPPVSLKTTEEDYRKKAKEIISSHSEHSPLTASGKETSVTYYAEKYLPTEGCSLIELPKDSDINYEPKRKAPKKEKASKKERTPKKNTPNKDSKQTSDVVQAKSDTEQTIVHASQTEKKQSKPEVTQGKSISMDREDRQWLEKLVEAEATGESYEGKLAVATVIANRIESNSFPNSVMGVIKQNNKVNPTPSTLKAVQEVFDKGVRNLPKDTLYFAVEDIVYDNWIGKTRKYTTTIGEHAFFSEKAK